MKNIYGISNTYSTKEDRMSVLTTYRRMLLKLLKEGYNPFEDNMDLYLKQKHTEHTIAQKMIDTEKVKKDVPKIIEKEDEKPTMTIKEAFDFGLKLKEKVIYENTKRGYVNKVKKFLEWITTNHSELTSINQLKKMIVVEFLNEVLENSSPRNRNNFRGDLSTIFQELVNNEIVPANFIKTIPKVRSIPTRNKTYTTKMQEAIFEYLKTEDPILLLFIKFVAYGFLRPIEICRLRVGDINLNENTIQFKAKNSKLKTKIIPEILLEDLPDELVKMNKELLLFTPNKIGGLWDATIGNRRDHFSKRFKKVVKDHFDLSKDYGMYSFRHTYITKVYRELCKSYAPFDAKSRLMLISGHTTMTALEKYLRDIDAELPSDYSHMLRTENIK
jgi:integrase